MAATIPVNASFEYISGLVRDGIPHLRELGVAVSEVAPGHLTLRLDYQEILIGHPETGVLHGGAITVLLDTVNGLAVLTALPEPAPMATLDLRIDYLKPATPGRAVLAQAHCFKVTRNIAFARGFAYHEEDGEPIAHCTGSFMLATAGQAVPVAPSGAAS